MWSWVWEGQNSVSKGITSSFVKSVDDEDFIWKTALTDPLVMYLHTMYDLVELQNSTLMYAWNISDGYKGKEGNQVWNVTLQRITSLVPSHHISETP